MFLNFNCTKESASPFKLPSIVAEETITAHLKTPYTTPIRGRKIKYFPSDVRGTTLCSGDTGTKIYQ